MLPADLSPGALEQIRRLAVVYTYYSLGMITRILLLAALVYLLSLAEFYALYLLNSISHQTKELVAPQSTVNGV